MPEMDTKAAPIGRLLDIMAQLRNPEGGCPWDLEQNFATIAPYTIEEAYEVADAIARNDMDELRGELGDLLFQVVFHSQMAAEEGLFDFHDVANAISEKMLSRHPHVFADAEIGNAEDQTAAWEEHKARERAERSDGKSASVMDDIALSLPALQRAAKLGKRASRAGFDWPSLDGVWDKVAEEGDELREATTPAEQEHELGDLLFAVVNLARHMRVDPEEALRKTNRRFETRFREVEAPGDLAELTLEQMEQRWQDAKRRLADQP